VSDFNPIWIFVPDFHKICQENPNLIKYEILINPLNAELNPICHLLALLRAHHFLHVSRIRVKLSSGNRAVIWRVDPQTERRTDMATVTFCINAKGPSEYQRQ
jgi:hypothetical protein